jgi:transcriptional regulator with XRE-family HTH domain
MILLIREYRLEKNLTVRKLASLAECSHSYITELENNKKKNPDLDVLDRIGHALNICPIRLFGGCKHAVCTPGCFYYHNKYNKYYYKLPLEGKIELARIIELSRIFELKYRNYLY